MKHRILIIAALLMTTAVSAQQYHRALPFYQRDEIPHLENILPGPPQLSDPAFSGDWSQYLWGKSIRYTERGQQAVADAHINAKYFMSRFSPAMSHEITPENNPILYELIQRAHRTEEVAGSSAKKHFARVRPYQQFKEATAVPEAENPRDFTSYPSGHTHASWLIGMILTAIDPVCTESIMKAAYEMGQSRVIVGYHYQSDVDAGRVAGSVTFARLCAKDEFLNMLQAAKEEFNK